MLFESIVRQSFLSEAQTPESLLPYGRGYIRVAPDDSIGVSRGGIVQPNEEVEMKIQTPYTPFDIPPNAHFGISVRSSLAQTGFDMKKSNFDHVNSQTHTIEGRVLFKNDSLYTLRVPEELPIGPIYWRHPMSLQGDALQKIVHDMQIQDVDVFTESFEYGELLCLPIANFIRLTHVPDGPIDLSVLPRGSIRKDLHRVLGLTVEKKGDSPQYYADPPITLVETIPLALPDAVYLFIVGAECRQNGQRVELLHTASTLLLEKDAKWGNRPLHTKIGEIYTKGHDLSKNPSDIFLLTRAYRYKQI